MKPKQLELLVLSAQSGNSRSLELLYRYYSPRMRRFAITLVPIAYVDDIVQLVWLKVFKRMARLDDPAVFASWLYRALRWEAADWHKKPENLNQQDIEAHTQTIEEQQETGIAEYHEIESGSALALAMTQLSLIEQQVIQLHYLSEMSLQQIALSLDIPLGTAKSRLHRARETLRKVLIKTHVENNDE